MIKNREATLKYGEQALNEGVGSISAACYPCRVGRSPDPWLIAKAMTINATVVTHEQLNTAARRKFLIANVCQHFGVPFVDTFELLNALEVRFVFASSS